MKRSIVANTETHTQDGVLDKALSECREYAERGRKLAEDALRLLDEVVVNVKEKLKEEIDHAVEVNADRVDFKDDNPLGDMRRQFEEIDRDFGMLPVEIRKRIRILNPDVFSITLFGRTMVGKSTLMEAITHGNGSSIGCGAQRKTRDVRSYTYRGMKITDVPGIAAFGGDDDEKVALEAAKAADLIIFMITNDAPQAAEAEWLKKMLMLAKPVIFIVNVKANINSPADMKMFRRDIDKKFGDGSLDAIRKQFCAFGKEYGQDWTSIPFVSASLKAAYLADKAEFAKYKDELLQLSRFGEVEEKIASIAKSNGRFYKFKAYADAVSVPLLNISERLANESVRSGIQADILARKSAELAQRTLDFQKKAKRDVNTLIGELKNEMKSEAASFSEDHCEDKNAGNAWKEVISKFHIEDKLKAFLEEKAFEAKGILEQIVKELQVEIDFAATFNRSRSHLDMDEIFDWKSAFEWGTRILTLVIAGIGFFVSGPIGWIAFGVGVAGAISSFFFDSKEEKIEKARKKLESKLREYIDSSMKEAHKKMNKAVDELAQKMFPEVKKLYALGEALAVLSVMQRQSSSRLVTKLRALNKMIVSEVLAFKGFAGLEYHIEDIARIPSSALVFAVRMGSEIPADARESIEDVLNERLSCISQDDQDRMLKMLLGDGYDNMQKTDVLDEWREWAGAHRDGIYSLMQSAGADFKDDATTNEVEEFVRKASKGFTHGHSGIVHVEGLKDMSPVQLNIFRLASQLTGLVFMDVLKGE